MIESELREALIFFKELKITIDDITTNQEKEEGYKFVKATYIFKGKKFTTKRLAYKDINKQDAVNNVDKHNEYFSSPVYWLDYIKHDWPHGPGAEIENRVIKDMLEDDDKDFEVLLKKIANNNKTGYLQKITREGRPQQYGFNLTNNNHWHDLIFFVQRVILKRGETPHKEYFKPLIFNWINGERQSLSPEFGGRLFIQKFIDNIKLYYSNSNDIQVENYIRLLEYKKQIILQGPPGTGKTYTAKDIAEHIIYNEITTDKQEQAKKLENSEYYKIVQFHPSFTYENFVRGIIATSEDGELTYTNRNEILGDFAAKANSNLLSSKEDNKELYKEEFIKELLIDFGEVIQDKIEKEGKYKLTDFVSIVDVEEETFRYKGNWKSSNRMKFKDIIKGILNNVNSRQDFRKLDSVSGLAKQHATYFLKVVQLFRNKYKNELKQLDDKQIKAKRKNNYVLIIDEINRANLSSVLGELIYALEYRDKPVESIYDIDGDSTIVLPSNLYIIGTMNTADRSVGHIDYAIQRRFAFVDILPNKEVINNKNAQKLFENIEALFVKQKDNKRVNANTLAADFNYKDIQLGHSYFILNEEENDDESFGSKKELELKLEYEIKPILNQYVKDGILIGEAQKRIDDLSVV